MKTLILVPTMYREKDIKQILGKTPPDFQKESEDFWKYIEEKLKQIAPTIRSIYLVQDEATMDPRGEKIVKSLENSGAKVHPLPDQPLVGEAKAWYLMSQNAENEIQQELLAEASREIQHLLDDMIASTLADSETGVILFEPTCTLSPQRDLRVIRMTPFDPLDYIRRHLILNKN